MLAKREEYIHTSIMTISAWLNDATRELTARDISTARLDAELILAHTVRKNRTWLHAHGEEPLDDRHHDIADARLRLRFDRVPVAYIIGHKEFYGRRFAVTTATLIPRPESETLIDQLARFLPSTPAHPRVVDVGTGSGALGITAKLEHEHIFVSLLDIDRHALSVAKKNATALHADVEIEQSDLLQNYPYKADVILANLPYVDKAWERSPETEHEPTLALFADNNGMALIQKLLSSALQFLEPNGIVILEADPVQHHALTSFAEGLGFTKRESEHYGLVLQLTGTARA